jgi:hypothetical protein
LKRQVPLILTTAMAIVVFLSVVSYSLTELQVQAKIDRMRQFMTAVLMFMGVANLLRVHGNVISKKERNWMFSGWLLVIMFVYMIFGMAVGNKNLTYRWFYDAIIVPVNGTMYALVAFYLTSASYKAFRARTAEAAIMMVCAAWVMVSNVPVGDFLWPSTSALGGMAGIRDWIVSVPNSAVSRAIAVGIFLGGFASNLRIFLGLERRHLGAG